MHAKKDRERAKGFAHTVFILKCVKCSTHAFIVNGHGETHHDYNDGTRGNGDDAGIKSTAHSKKKQKKSGNEINGERE